ncbi:hypothetical protein [Catenulispora pinisilvae]|uniref:hypothetical protein n=1 Tax=Catenulispora pinisilvae TaxID=2705253 RepID=UPI001891C268|nr:hypothetical protein [Catenulispora pinisilvae]
MRRHVVFIAAASAALVALAGCSSGSRQKAAAPAAASAPTQPTQRAQSTPDQAVGTAALKAMLLTPAEVGTGWTAAQPVQTSDGVPIDTRDVALTSGGPDCQASADVVGGVPAYNTLAVADTVIQNAGGTGGFGQMLSVLKPADAEYVVPHLRDTVRACGGEVDYTPWSNAYRLGGAKDGQKYTITGVDSPNLGDDSASFSISLLDAAPGPDGEPATAVMTAVRVGSVVGYYWRMGYTPANDVVTTAVAKLKQSVGAAAGA